MSDSVKKYHEMMEQKQMFPETPKKADIVLVRLGFSDVVITREENERFNGHVDLISEVECDDCSVMATTESYLIGYEDEDGRECDENGNYLGSDPSQTHLFFQ